MRIVYTTRITISRITLYCLFSTHTKKTVVTFTLHYFTFFHFRNSLLFQEITISDSEIRLFNIFTSEIQKMHDFQFRNSLLLLKEFIVTTSGIHEFTISTSGIHGIRFRNLLFQLHEFLRLKQYSPAPSFVGQVCHVIDPANRD